MIKIPIFIPRKSLTELLIFWNFDYPGKNEKTAIFIDFWPRVKKWTFLGGKIRFFRFFDFSRKYWKLQKSEKMENSIKSIFYPGYNFWQKMLAGGVDGGRKNFSAPRRKKMSIGKLSEKNPGLEKSFRGRLKFRFSRKKWVEQLSVQNSIFDPPEKWKKWHFLGYLCFLIKGSLKSQNCKFSLF